MTAGRQKADEYPEAAAALGRLRVCLEAETAGLGPVELQWLLQEVQAELDARLDAMEDAAIKAGRRLPADPLP